MPFSEMRKTGRSGQRGKDLEFRMPCESPEETSRQLDLSRELSGEVWVV